MPDLSGSTTKKLFLCVSSLIVFTEELLYDCFGLYPLSPLSEMQDADHVFLMFLPAGLPDIREYMGWLQEMIDISMACNAHIGIRIKINQN